LIAQTNFLFLVDNETNHSLLPSTYTITRKPNLTTLKPLRKKPKLQIIVEPSISSRLSNNDEQVHSITSSSSNQTTPRSIRPINDPIKPKAITPLGHYPNQEQIRAHINRSVIERQHPTFLPIPIRKGVRQYMLPFDASPSKVNNHLHRHHMQPTNIFQPSKYFYFILYSFLSN
jgi:hypothetical protein